MKLSTENYISEETLYSIVDKANKYNKLLKLQKKPVLCCSFCGKSQNEVAKLIAGATVCICNECVDLCVEIIQEENKENSEE